MLDGGQRVNVVGEASCQEALGRICGGKCETSQDLTVTAALVPEPTNPYDSNAVMVQVNGTRVGYLSRDDAVAYQPVLRQVAERGGVAMAEGRIVGGWDRGGGDEGSFGIWLDLGDPATCLPPPCR